MSNSIVSIKSLSDFISKISNLSETYYFRGEPKDFGPTKNQSSGYRWMQENDKNFENLISLRRGYFKEIGYTLSSYDIENFIAYSQHHGLPTELLDITENPLVALYFAVEKSEDQKTDGYIYAFSKDTVVDLEGTLVNSSLEKQKLDIDFALSRLVDKNHGYWDNIDKYEDLIKKYNNLIREDESFQFYDLFPLSDEGNISNDIEEKNRTLNEIFRVYIKALEVLRKSGKQTIKEGYTNIINKDKVFYYPNGLDNLSVENVIFEAILFSDNDEEFERHYGKEFKERIKISLLRGFRRQVFSLIEPDDSYREQSPKDREVLHDKFLLDISIKFAKNSPEENSKQSTMVNYFPKGKYFLHQPSVIFDRMRNQSGKFIYQLCIKKVQKGYVYQELIPDKIFRIPNGLKKEVGDQLNTIGINRKFVFPDSDNIAKYVKENFIK